MAPVRTCYIQPIVSKDAFFQTLSDLLPDGYRLGSESIERLHVAAEEAMGQIFCRCFHLCSPLWSAYSFLDGCAAPDPIKLSGSTCSVPSASRFESPCSKGIRLLQKLKPHDHAFAGWVPTGPEKPSAGVKGPSHSGEWNLLSSRRMEYMYTSDMSTNE